MDNVRSFLSGVLPTERQTPTAMAPQLRNEAFAQFLDRWSGFREGSPEAKAGQTPQAGIEVSDCAAAKSAGVVGSEMSLMQPMAKTDSQVISGRAEAAAVGSIQGAREASARSGAAFWQASKPVVGSSAASESGSAATNGRPEKYHWSRLAASVVTDPVLGAALVIRGDSGSARLLKANLDRLHALAQELGIPLSGVVVNGDHVVQTVRGDGNGH